MGNWKEKVSRQFVKLQLKWLLRTDCAHKDILKILLQWVEMLEDHGQVKKFSDIEEVRRRLKSDSKGFLFQDLVSEEAAWVRKAATWGRSWQWSSLLYFLVRDLNKINIMEVGTCLGLSASYMGLAIREKGCGVVNTFEINPILAKKSKQVCDHLGLDFIQVHNQFRVQDFKDFFVGNPSIDFVFLDGDHQGDTTIEIVDFLAAHCGNDLVVVFDDIRWSKEMRSTWRKIMKNKHVSLSIDLHFMGLCRIQNENAKSQKHYLATFFH